MDRQVIYYEINCSIKYVRFDLQYKYQLPIIFIKSSRYSYDTLKYDIVLFYVTIEIPIRMKER